ncbi:membrane protein [Philodulcilactobacillus myokoensis]|uniref:Membrane protein n=1 Tax=Philodulcilactobacillus myokoensis TaxID=2929573 RepID=A0A9W6AY39_9LACO|nr:DMT family transporter [Philodulcilactobacillus myokoensis]GLB46069.1 membrane protein [Philodulcilactobacillus myokoensis]
MLIANVIIGLLIGVELPLQTSINSSLGKRAGSPFLATTTNFAVGTIFLAIVTLLIGQSLWISKAALVANPWWIWLGGILGDIAITANVLLFPRLGAIQTVIMPILGQIIMSMMIDNFGLFHSPEFPFTWIRLVGVLVLFAGVLIVVVQPGLLSQDKETKSHGALLWQIIGVIAGMCQASQTAINGQLGVALNSPIKASYVSFITGTIALIVFVGILEHDFNHLKRAIGKGNPWWLWIGGIMGSLFVLGNLFIAPRIGTGAAVVLALLGNIIGSLIVDKFGVFDSPKKFVGGRQYAGIAIMILGVVLVKLF